MSVDLYRWKYAFECNWKFKGLVLNEILGLIDTNSFRLLNRSIAVPSRLALVINTGYNSTTLLLKLTLGEVIHHVCLY